MPLQSAVSFHRNSSCTISYTLRTPWSLQISCGSNSTTAFGVQISYDRPLNVIRQLHWERSTSQQKAQFVFVHAVLVAAVARAPAAVCRSKGVFSLPAQPAENSLRTLVGLKAAIEYASLVVRETKMREILPAWGPLMITQSARSIAKWIVCFLFTNCSHKVREKRGRLSQAHLACMKAPSQFQVCSKWLPVPGPQLPGRRDNRCSAYSSVNQGVSNSLRGRMIPRALTGLS